MASRPYKVGIIGYGLSAKIFHIPILQALPQDYQIHAIVQRSPKAGDDATEDLHGIRSFRSVEDMLRDSGVDLVIVTTPPATHFNFCKLALEADKHVVVEKPVTPTSQEARKLIELAARQNRVLAVYQNRRWDSDFLTLSALIEKDAFGRIAEFESHFDRHRPHASSSSSWKAEALPGGGAIYDLGVHLLDQIVHLFGLPDRVTAFIGFQRHPPGPEGAEDSFTVLCHYESKGLLATAKAGVVSPETSQLRYWLRGTEGGYKKYHLDCQEDQLKAGLRPGRDEKFGIETSERAGLSTSLDTKGLVVETKVDPVKPATYVEFYRLLASALRGKSQPPVTAKEAELVIRLIELAKLSSKKGCTIKVSEREETIDGG